MKIKKFKFIIIAVMSMLTIKTNFASGNELDVVLPYLSTTAGVSVTTTLINPAAVGAGATTYTKYGITAGLIIAIVWDIKDLYNCYKRKKMAQAEARSFLMKKNGDLNNISINLRSTIDDLRNDIQISAAERKPNQKILERIDSDEKFNENIKDDKFLIAALANL